MYFESKIPSLCNGQKIVFLYTKRRKRMNFYQIHSQVNDCVEKKKQIESKDGTTQNESGKKLSKRIVTCQKRDS